MSFNNLNPAIRKLRATTPARVFSTQNPDDETDEQIDIRIDRFSRLPKKIQSKLSALELSGKIQFIGQKYNFDLLRLANITRLIREFYFGEIRLEDFPREVEKRMGVSLLTAQEISRYLKTEILDWDPWAEYVATLPKFPIRELLVKFPEIGDQLITENEIEIKNFPEPMRPSIRNWLHDYTQHLGQERHSSMQRMDYVFHSENTKRLSSPDREKLAIILRSFDDNEPLPIDQENNEVLFDAVENRSEIPKSFPPKGIMAKKPEAAANFASSQAPSAHISSPDFTRQPNNNPSPPKIPSAEFIKPYPQTAPPKQAPASQTFTGMKSYSPPATPRPIPAALPNISQQPQKQPERSMQFYTPPPQSQKKYNPTKPIPRVQGPTQPEKIQFTNPYPDPGTHEVHFSSPEKNITNVRFAEGAPKEGGIQAKISPPRIPPRILRPTNIIRPYSVSEPSLNIPDPRIEGNLVDLSGRIDQ
jgi:hypothetical protein